MNCKEFEKKIPDFINQTMDFPTLKEFSGHMEHCEGCKEELIIQFLVTEGMQRLEEGDAFDLQRELDERLEAAKHRIRLHSAVIRAGVVLEIIAVLALLGIVLWLVL